MDVLVILFMLAVIVFAIASLPVALAALARGRPFLLAISGIIVAIGLFVLASEVSPRRDGAVQGGGARSGP